MRPWKCVPGRWAKVQVRQVSLNQNTAPERARFARRRGLRYGLAGLGVCASAVRCNLLILTRYRATASCPIFQSPPNAYSNLHRILPNPLLPLLLSAPAGDLSSSRTAPIRRSPCTIGTDSTVHMHTFHNSTIDARCTTLSTLARKAAPTEYSGPPGPSRFCLRLGHRCPETCMRRLRHAVRAELRMGPTGGQSRARADTRTTGCRAPVLIAYARACTSV